MKKILILLVIVGISYFVYLNNTGVTALKNSGNQNGESNSDNIYTNTKFNYQITVPKGWRVSESMSKKMAEWRFSDVMVEGYRCGSQGLTEEGGDTYLIDKDCVKNNPDVSRHILKNQRYLNEWNIENAQDVFITRLPKSEELSLSVDQYSIYGYSAPEGSFVYIGAGRAATSSKTTRPYYVVTPISTTEKDPIDDEITSLLIYSNTVKMNKENESISDMIKSFKILK